MVAGNKFRVFRRGLPNLFTTASPIKNIYRRNTSIHWRQPMVEMMQGL
jgi:hypothetical protein